MKIRYCQLKGARYIYAEKDNGKIVTIDAKKYEVETHFGFRVIYINGKYVNLVCKENEAELKLIEQNSRKEFAKTNG